MPNVFPTVNVLTEDKSDVILLNISIIEAMVGRFDRGPDDEPLLVTTKKFKQYFGEIADAPDKQAYVSAAKILERAEGLLLLNVTKNAKYGGILFYDEMIAEVVADSGNAGDDTAEEGGTYTGDEDGTFRITVTNAGVYGGTGEVTVYFTPYGDSETTVGTVNPSDSTAFTLDDGVTLTLTDGGDGVLTLADEWTVRVFAKGVLPLPEGVTSKDSYTFDSDITDEDLGNGDSSTVSFSGTLLYTPIQPGSVSITYTIDGSEKTATDDGDGSITGDSISSATINYFTGAWSITFSSAPDGSTSITADYTTADYLFIIIARSKRAWSDNVGVKVTEIDTTENSFLVEIYEKDSEGNANLITELNVSRDETKVDGFGKNIFIETIFEDENYLLYALNNDDTINTIRPLVASSITYCDGGADGDTPSSTEYASAIDLFTPSNMYFDLFIGAGITEKTVIDEIVDLCDTKKKEAFIDTTQSTSYSTIISWVQNTLALDAMRVSCYTPNQYVSYEGSQYLCPISALAGRQKAAVTRNGQPFMPPAGIGSERGTLNVIKQYTYFEDTEIALMYKANINVVRYFKNYGNVLFSDFTLQRKTSATSYQNSVTTLDQMISEFENALLVINFKVINDATFLQLETLIDNYLIQLSRYDGTIEQGWVIDFGDNDDVTRDAGEVKVKVIFVFQQLAREIELKLTYTSNALFSEISGV